jgi:mono/diheme cytochrome c family protein
MTPTGGRTAFEGPPRRARPRRWLQYTLGSLLAFIAGVAVTLALLLPLTRRASTRPAVTNPHVGMTTAPGIAPQNCASCHESGPGARPR